MLQRLMQTLPHASPQRALQLSRVATIDLVLITTARLCGSRVSHNKTQMRPIDIEFVHDVTHTSKICFY